MSSLVDWSPDSDYEVRKCNKPEGMFGMTREEWEKTLLKAAEMSCEEAKNEDG